MPHYHRWKVVWLPALIVLGFLLSKPASAADTKAVWLLLLEGDSTATTERAARKSGARLLDARLAVAARASAIAQQHTEITGAIEGLGGRVTHRYSKLLNLVSVEISSEQTNRLNGLPGVIEMQPRKLFYRSLETSVPFIEGPVAWKSQAKGLSGEGITIGIIDSGIDYTHADFGGSGNVAVFDSNNSARIEVGSFPTAKVIGGMDFVGDDYDGSDSDHSTPFPDSDPLDSKAHGHGTHVAGIAAGFGVLTSGKTYRGTYTNLPPMSEFLIAPGVAPRARLYAWKIFGHEGPTATEAVLSAIEACADPNGDGSFDDRLDVANLSLGSSFGTEGGRDFEQSAVNSLSQLGCIVVVAAGNDGNVVANMSSPAVAARAIAVANSVDNGSASLQVRVNAPVSVAGLYSAVEGAFTVPLADIAAVTAQVVQVLPTQACEELSNGAALKGKIAMIERGVCFFTDKIRKAQAAGVVGVIMVNNVDGDPIPMGGSGDTDDIKIPGIMISKAEGARLAAELANGVNVTLSADTVVPHPERADRLADSSSRGPSQPNYRLKPDLSAPGTEIRSARAGSGFRPVVLDGTSMSCPHVAGAAALLRQAHPAWPVEDIKAALMNTAVGLFDENHHPYPESKVGAGRLNVAAAVRTPVIARVDTQDGEVSVNFGLLELSLPHTETRQIRLVNHGTKAVRFDVAVSNTIPCPGFILTPSLATISVPGQGAAIMTVRMDADPSKFERMMDPTSGPLDATHPRTLLPEASGQIWFRGEELALHVPFMAVPRAVGNLASARSEVGVMTGDPGLAAVAIKGTRVHSEPLVSAFVLGGTNGVRGLSGPRAAADQVAFGAASDFSTAGSVSNTTVYFGIALAGNWTTPQRAFNSINVQIDLNNNDRPEFEVINTSIEGVVSNSVSRRDSMNDGFVSGILNSATDEIVDGGLLNVLPPDKFDTALLANSVMILPAPARAIGLTETTARFRYRFMTVVESVTESSSWIPFDAAKPGIDTTRHGLEHSPLFHESGPIKFEVDRSEFTRTTPTVLLLHHNNTLKSRWELVRLNLASQDLDSDGLPDAWEAEFLNDFASDGPEDRDGDGYNDQKEYVAGTDPRNASSYLQLQPPNSPDFTVSWQAVEVRTYTLERSSTLNGPFTPVQTGIQGSVPRTDFKDASATGPGPFFYRLRSP